MQITSMTGSTPKGATSKSTNKSRNRAKAAPAAETLHLKSKHLVEAATNDLAPMIATAAYYRAEQRGFEPGHELEDWLDAERQVQAQYC